jgi:hypothetical protein
MMIWLIALKGKECKFNVSHDTASDDEDTCHKGLSLEQKEREEEQFILVCIRFIIIINIALHLKTEESIIRLILFYSK